MTRWDDDDFDDDEPDEPEGEDDLTAPCPHCGATIFDDSERCPECGRYLSREDAPPTSRPWWFVLGFVAALYVVYRWVFGG